MSSSGTRVDSLAFVVLTILATRALVPDPGARRDSLLLLALGLGYGHQLGALCFARKRRPLEWALLAVSALSAGLAFALALASPAALWLVLALALLAAWHVLENDLALSRAKPGSLRLPPLPRAWAPHAALVAASALVVAVALLAPRAAPHLVAAGVAPWLAIWSPEEVIAALLLYHSATWLARGLASTPRRAKVLLAHALPLVALAGAQELVPGWFAWAVAPPIYLFLSGAHAFQTCAERGLDAA